MNRRWLAVIEFFAASLSREERAAVIGDILESRRTVPLALRDVLGLVARRQAHLWTHWQPWLALIGLSYICLPFIQVLFEVSAPIIWNIKTYTQVGSFYKSGLTFGEEALSLLVLAGGAILWSWTSGFLLASLSSRTAWITGTVCLLLTSYRLPREFYFVGQLLLSHSEKAPFLVLILIVQIMVHIGLFLMPVFLGFRSTIPPQKQILVSAATLLFTGLNIWIGGWGAAAVGRWAGGAWNASPGWQNRLLTFGALCWPAIYLTLTQHRRRTSAHSVPPADSR